MQKRNRHIIVFLLSAAILVFGGCAKITAPTGGPKDTTPPKVLKTDPADGTVQFGEKHIRIYFDEFITLNNPSEKVLISPPLATTPEYLIKGKSLIIKFKDTLRANTTYNMVFSDCIKDYHEGNPQSYFHYSFSTGDSLDDYMIRGILYDAKTLAPAKDFLVMLYKGSADSLPRTTLPDYVSKSLSDGSFSLKNITAGEYRIFALKDINANFRYDLPNEEIAFLDEPVSAFRALPDSVADSLKAALPSITLMAFVAEDTVQQLARYENPSAGLYVFPYKRHINQFSATPLSHGPEYFERINESRDTVFWYFKEILTDTATFVLRADDKVDTVKLSPFRASQSTGRGRTVERNVLSVKFANAGERHLPLTLQFPYPVHPTDSFNVWLYSQHQDQKDTACLRFAIPDTFSLQFPLPMTLAEKKSYTVMIPDSVFFGYNGLVNDTLKSQFTTKSEKDYGTLIMNYQLPEDNNQYIAILQSNGKTLCSDVLTSSKTLTYSHLLPGAYLISAFCDENGNGRWDPGDYRGKRQPEKMYVFPQEINIRAYWDSEETFKIGSSN